MVPHLKVLSSPLISPLVRILCLCTSVISSCRGNAKSWASQSCSGLAQMEEGCCRKGRNRDVNCHGNQQVFVVERCLCNLKPVTFSLTKENTLTQTRKL